MKAVKTSSNARHHFAWLIEYWRRSLPASLPDYAAWQMARLNELQKILMDQQLWTQSQLEPMYIPPLHGYLYQNGLYKVDAPLTEDQKCLLVREAFDAERRKFERLSHKFAGAASGTVRTKIPEQTRIEVWRRDGGACAKCGSRERLEYDHIIPVSKGGSNTARNVELLCESCNRAKQAEIQ